MYWNVHTCFSFKYGTLQPAALFEEARRCGVHRLVLTDINSTAAYIELLRICRERAHEHLLCVGLGIEFRNDDSLAFIGIARNNKGFEELNRYLTHQTHSGKPFPRQAPEFAQVEVVYPWPGPAPEALRAHEWVGIKASQLNLLLSSPYRQHPQRLVAWQPVSFANTIDFHVHRLLRSIHHNTLLSKLAPHQQGSPDACMVPPATLEQTFRHYPLLIANARHLVACSEVVFDLGTDKNKRSFLGSPAEDRDYLVTTAWEHFHTRYDAADARLRERFQRELDIIFQKNFTAYYLIAYDVVRYARAQGFDHVGRGSGANSMIAYCLGITNVDPMELNLYFERFLNPERASPPDFDLDFSWRDRDRITDYLFARHGQEHTCLLGTHTTYQFRSILRELGKVFGLPRNEIDALVHEPDRHKDKDHITRLIFRYAARMQDLPANFSIHAGGVLITEAPIYAYTATALPPKGYPVSHFEMHNAEDMGIYKFDILSQRGLGHIRDAVEIISKNTGHKVDAYAYEAFKSDEKVKDLLRHGHTMGCFYVESPAMRMLLGKLRCDDYLTLVAASSIIRPGVARSGMMRAYIERHHLVREGKAYASIHPLMDDLMAETYGVMVYQEDVIKVAHHFGGLSLSEADVLRRGMSGKYRSRQEFKRVEEAFFDNCRQRGYPQEVVERVWFEIESFSGYSFAKGHSASYAVESYQSLWLKAHYPLEFMVAVINNFGGFYSTEFYFHEARQSGATVEAPCINRSGYLTGISGKEIVIGFIHLKSLESKWAHRIVEERQRGEYVSLDNFIRRVPMGLEQLRILIRIGALRCTGRSRQELLWEAMLYFGQSQASRQLTPLFEDPPMSFSLPTLSRTFAEDAFDEIELLGFPLCDPFLLVDTTDFGTVRARELLAVVGQRVSVVGYLVTTKDTRTKKGERMHFGTFYDSEGQVFDTTHFPREAARYPFRGRGFYRIVGKVVLDFGYPMIEVSSMDKLPMVQKLGVAAEKWSLIELAKQQERG